MTPSLSRRQLAGLLASLGSVPIIGTPLFSAFAQERSLDVRTGGSFKPIPIAVTQFAGDGGAQVTSIITNNFKRSVFITPVDRASFSQEAGNPDQAPMMDAFRAVNAQYVVTGRSSRGGDGRVQTAFRLWDVSTGAQVTGQQYATDANNLRRVAHLVSDAVFSKVTGEKGFFDTRVVFIDESGPAEHRRKRLAIMDQDGAGVRYLTRGDDLVVTPRFSPTSQDITYMAFGNANPKVLFMNIETGQKEAVGNFPGMTFAPRFAPEGEKIIMSLSEGSSSNLYTMDLQSKATTRLTDTQAIDTSPSYAPDGSRIAFESDRGGTQQIYVMGAGGGSAQRISFGDGRYSTPVWSPKGDYIAFTKQSKGGFGIGVMKPDGSGERLLTEGFHNEGPTWAPNGLFLMFFRDPGGGGASRIFMTDVFGRAEFAVPTPTSASDPAWSPLLSA
ncbi:Tol-Pal system beta propeller repeat protein TolB [Beijerinckia sp. L45]|uniref:Tol-Pal system beta propeller repeat protein TolB n=1 Tax=Beijerinckia sp. L45 TaxID=1641855 RepID=UPI00131CDA8D|nr:Tol-Pal system beta propeller repeat protein TolB [Beijerinckia sp. L45]